jgi:hypothetical protein
VGESAVRFIADNAQRWALRYDFLNTALAGAALVPAASHPLGFRSMPRLAAGCGLRIKD